MSAASLAGKPILEWCHAASETLLKLRIISSVLSSKKKLLCNSILKRHPFHPKDSFHFHNIKGPHYISHSITKTSKEQVLLLTQSPITGFKAVSSLTESVIFGIQQLKQNQQWSGFSALPMINTMFFTFLRQNAPKSWHLSSYKLSYFSINFQ